ncbi:hypothetical protein VKT23_019134 [Stygiomarasmius scandens]|uniref:Transmembrane protein n=1 Tax=Marasmiellus scandens TaxID=2682957 RepID=A0ABR1IRF3_9AGAR
MNERVEFILTEIYSTIGNTERRTHDHSRATSIASSSRSIPILKVVPDSPESSHGQKTRNSNVGQTDEYYDRKSEEFLNVDGPSTDHSERHVHYLPGTGADDDSASMHDAPSHGHASTRSFRPPTEPIPRTQHQILTALAIGAPLIASVVSSCTSVICADLTSALGSDPITRPAKASVVVTLLWCALITSLGSTMTAVAGLAMHAGYHDSHVGVTKRIVRFLRQWREERKAAKSMKRESRLDSRQLEIPLPDHSKSNIYLDVRVPSPALSTVTDGHREQHMIASFRAAVVSARLLGLSVALLGTGIAVYLFLLYPLSVAVTTLVVGLGTTVVAAAPLLPIVMPRQSR